MRSICHECGKTVYEPNRERQRQVRARYDEYETLLAYALAAAAEACADYLAALPAHYKADHGEVWISLDDGTSSFAHFLRVRHPGMFRYYNRRTKTSYLLDIEDYQAAMNYAMAFCDVLIKGGVSVTVNNKPISREN